MTINYYSHDDDYDDDDDNDDDDDDDDNDNDNDNDNGGNRHPTPLWKHHSALSTYILTLKIQPGTSTSIFQPGIADTPIP